MLKFGLKFGVVFTQGRYQETSQVFIQKVNLQAWRKETILTMKLFPAA
jgi:hypothetical protein